MPKPSDLLQGTLDLLILKTVGAGRCTGGRSRRIRSCRTTCCRSSRDRSTLPLTRLERQGWITAVWKETDLGRSAKFYSLTRDGRQQLEREQENWNRLSSAVRLLLKRA